MSKTHSPISPSNFERRMLCPGSLNAEKGLPYTTSVYAETGTMLHDKVNEYITGAKWLYTDEHDDIIFPFYHNLTEQQQTAVIDAGKYYRDLTFSNLQVVKEIHEQTFSLDFLMPGMQGTADSVLILYDKEKNRCQIHVIDYKFGQGVAVKAQDNYQLMLYALGVYMHPEISNVVRYKCNLGSNQQPFRFTTAHLHIVQPYLENSRWDLSDEQLTSLITGSRMQLIKTAIANAQEENAVRIPSTKACQFCKAKPTCYALNSLVPTLNNKDTKELLAAKVRLLSDEELGRIYDNKDLIKTYLTSVEEYIKEKLETGEFLNYKLMPKMSNRKWIDEAESVLRDKLGEDAYEKKIIGIGRAEKLIGKDEVNRLTKKELGENQIVKLDYSIEKYL